MCIGDLTARVGDLEGDGRVVVVVVFQDRLAGVAVHAESERDFAAVLRAVQVFNAALEKRNGDVVGRVANGAPFHDLADGGIGQRSKAGAVNGGGGGRGDGDNRPDVGISSSHSRLLSC